MKNHKLQPIFYSLLVIIGILIGTKINLSTYKKTIFNKKIDTIIDLIDNHYVDSISKPDFNEKIIKSILGHLDPHSSYINSDKYKNVEEDMQGSFSGIGVQFNIIEDTIVVVAAISGGPSKKLGVLSGDRIITIEKENVTNINIADASYDYFETNKDWGILELEGDHL